MSKAPNHSLLKQSQKINNFSGFLDLDYKYSQQREVLTLKITPALRYVLQSKQRRIPLLNATPSPAPAPGGGQPHSRCFWCHRSDTNFRALQSLREEKISCLSTNSFIISWIKMEKAFKIWTKNECSTFTCSQGSGVSES